MISNFSLLSLLLLLLLIVDLAAGAVTSDRWVVHGGTVGRHFAVDAQPGQPIFVSVDACSGIVEWSVSFQQSGASNATEVVQLQSPQSTYVGVWSLDAPGTALLHVQTAPGVLRAGVSVLLASGADVARFTAPLRSVELALARGQLVLNYDSSSSSSGSAGVRYCAFARPHTTGVPSGITSSCGAFERYVTEQQLGACIVDDGRSNSDGTVAPLNIAASVDAMLAVARQGAADDTDVRIDVFATVDSQWLQSLPPIVVHRTALECLSDSASDNQTSGNSSTTAIIVIIIVALLLIGLAFGGGVVFGTKRAQVQVA